MFLVGFPSLEAAVEKLSIFTLCYVSRNTALKIVLTVEVFIDIFDQTVQFKTTAGIPVVKQQNIFRKTNFTIIKMTH